MKGLDIARQYYEHCGKEMLQKEFPHLIPYLAVGLAGSGSECYGFDDALSRDHDFEPCFCIFLPDETVVDRKEAFRLERAYEKLPKEFMGLKKSPLDPVGGRRHGVIRTEDFFLEKIGSPNGALSDEAWLSLPEYGLLEATNGEVFFDAYGKFTEIRKKLSYFPEDIRRKKLAGRLLLMGQAGQYNYPRCIARGETGAAQLALFEFVQSAIHAVYLLNRRYTPYYKWFFRGMRDLSLGSELSEDLEFLITSGNTPDEAKRKSHAVERTVKTVSAAVQKEGLASAGSEAETLAYEVNDSIRDPEIRNLNILYGV